MPCQPAGTNEGEYPNPLPTPLPLTLSDQVTPSDPSRGFPSLRPAPPTHVLRWGECPFSSKGVPAFLKSRKSGLVKILKISSNWNGRRKKISVRMALISERFIRTSKRRRNVTHFFDFSYVTSSFCNRKPGLSQPVKVLISLLAGL